MTKYLRWILIGLSILGLLFFLSLSLFLADALVNLWHNLSQSPLWLQALIISLLGGFALGSIWVIYRLLRPHKAVTKTEAPAADDLEQRIEQAKEQGLDLSAVEAELEQLKRRKQAGHIYIALFGEISAGKSSLIKALLPEIEIKRHVVGGTTQSIDHYHWRSPVGDELILIDMPGLDEVGGTRLEEQIKEEALKAHIVLYIVDGDLTRSQAEELKRLLALHKPTLVVLNKMDRLRPDELELVVNKLQERVDALGQAQVVPVSTGAVVPAIRILPDGRQEEIEKELPPKIEALQIALQNLIDSHEETLEQLRDSSVFVLIQQKLDQEAQKQRAEKATEITQSYAKKAVLAAMAAVTPGTDILIQGYLGSQMVKALCQLYEQPIRKVDLDLLLELVQKRARTQITVIMAIIGNAMKAFPGAGTLAGGAVHAVAYGLLFDALGKSVAQALASRGQLHPLQVANQFEDTLSEDIKKTATQYARLVFQEIKAKDTRSASS